MINRFVATLFVCLASFILTIKLMVEFFVWSEGKDSAVGLPYESFIDRMQAGWSWPLVLTNMAILLALAAASWAFLPTGENQDDARPDTAPNGASQLSLSSDASDAKTQVDSLVGRLSHMPVEAFDVTTRNEFEAIRGKHLPALEQAHREARETVLDGSADATAIDADYAESLHLLAGTLNKLAADCSARARTDLTVQHRFIEMRHAPAADPLSLDGEKR